MNRMIIDTETTGNINNVSTIEVYDIGYVILDSECNVIVKKNYLIAETFSDQDKMNSAYYADKLPRYYQLLADQSIEIKPFIEIWREFTELCKAYNIKQIWAHNARFDRNALNNTMHILSNGFRSYFAPYGTEWLDILTLARETFCLSRKFYRFVSDHRYITSKGYPQTTAEVCYRYLINDTSFIESHTALSDALIEAEILKRGLKYHRKHSRKFAGGLVTLNKAFREWGEA